MRLTFMPSGKSGRWVCALLIVTLSVPPALGAETQPEAERDRMLRDLPSAGPCAWNLWIAAGGLLYVRQVALQHWDLGATGPQSLVAAQVIETASSIDTARAPLKYSALLTRKPEAGEPNVVNCRDAGPGNRSDCLPPPEKAAASQQGELSDTADELPATESEEARVQPRYIPAPAAAARPESARSVSRSVSTDSHSR